MFCESQIKNPLCQPEKCWKNVKWITGSDLRLTMITTREWQQQIHENYCLIYEGVSKTFQTESMMKQTNKQTNKQKQ
jgi:hypothetical protein